MKNILFIVGSSRQGSYNQQLAEWMCQLLPTNQYHTRQLDYQSLPFFDFDIEFPTPRSVELLREDWQWADKIIFITPSYNGTMPGRLKNMLDWVSRPVNKIEKGAPTFVKNKSVMVACVAGGVNGSQAAIVTKGTQEMLERMGMAVDANAINISLSSKSWQNGQLKLDDEHLATIKEVTEQFLITLPDQVAI